MKKTLILLAFALIIGTAQLDAMKRAASQITTNEPQAELWLPNEMITKIAAICHPDARISLSLVNKLFNRHASARKEEGEILLDKKDRLYYLFYGCIHNLENLVKNALCYFEPEKKQINTWAEEYPDKILLNKVKNCIEQITHSNTANLLPCYPDIKIHSTIIRPLHLAINNNDDTLFALLLKQSRIDFAARKQALSSLFAMCYSNSYIDKASSSMIKLLLNYPDDVIHSPTLNVGLCSHNLTLIKLLLDYPGTNINAIRIGGLGENRGTPLHLLNVDLNMIAKSLLTHPDCNVNIQDGYGDTPLHCAISKKNSDPSAKGSLERVQLLLTHPNIDITITNNEGTTPLTSALKQLKNLQNKMTNEEVDNWQAEKYEERITEYRAIIRQLLLTHGMLNNTQRYTGKKKHRKFNENPMLF